MKQSDTNRGQANAFDEKEKQWQFESREHALSLAVTFNNRASKRQTKEIKDFCLDWCTARDHKTNFASETSLQWCYSAIQCF